MNQEQGGVLDNEISCWFCFPTTRFTFPEVKIYPWRVYTMWATNSSVFGARALEILDRHIKCKWHICVFILQTTSHCSRDLNLGAGCTLNPPGHTFHLGQSKLLLPPSQVWAGQWLCPGISQLSEQKRLNVHPFTHCSSFRKHFMSI